MFPLKATPLLIRLKRSTCLLQFNRQLVIDNAAEKGDIDLLGDGRCDSLS